MPLLAFPFPCFHDSDRYALMCRVTRDSDPDVEVPKEVRHQLIADAATAWGLAGPSPAVGILMTSAPHQDPAIGPHTAAAGGLALPAGVPLEIAQQRREVSGGEAAGKRMLCVIVRKKKKGQGHGRDQHQVAKAGRLQRAATM